MNINVGIQQPPNHALILGAVFSGLRLEELDALLAQGDSDLDAFLPKYKVIGRREKIRNYLEIAQRLICVAYFRAHKLPYLSASNRRQIYVSHRYDM